MGQLRHEIYDVEGNIVKVEFIETDEPSIEEVIFDKEAELIKIYNEIQQLKGNQ